MNMKEQARDFLRAIYELNADGTDQQKAALLVSLLQWQRPLERILTEAYKEGMTQYVAPEVLKVIEEINTEENEDRCSWGFPGCKLDHAVSYPGVPS